MASGTQQSPFNPLHSVLLGPPKTMKGAEERTWIWGSGRSTANTSLLFILEPMSFLLLTLSLMGRILLSLCISGCLCIAVMLPFLSICNPLCLPLCLSYCSNPTCLPRPPTPSLSGHLLSPSRALACSPRHKSLNQHFPPIPEMTSDCGGSGLELPGSGPCGLLGHTSPVEVAPPLSSQCVGCLL